MANPAFRGMIIFSKRDNVRSMFRAECRALGFAEAVLPDSEDAAIEQLFYHQGALLVLDGAIGLRGSAKLMQAAKGHFKIETRAILLIVDQLTEAIAASAAEFGVSMVLTGEISKQIVHERLQKLSNNEMQTQPLKEKLVQLAFARERKDLEFAGRIVNEMERQFPNSPRVVVEKADNLILAEKWDEAMQVLTPLREKNPPNLRALHLTGRCLARSGDHAGALSVLTAANLLNPHNAARLVDIGNILLETNEFLKAKDTFDEALDMEKENRDAKVGKAKCLLLEGEVNDALELTKQLSGPRELAAIFNTTAVLSIRHGDYDKGMQLYRHAIKAVMDSKSLSARLFFNLGVAYHRQGRPKDAKAQFEKSAQLDPEFAKAIHNVRAMGQRKLAAGAEYSAPMAEESEFVDLFASQDEDEFE